MIPQAQGPGLVIAGRGGRESDGRLPVPSYGHQLPGLGPGHEFGKLGLGFGDVHLNGHRANLGVSQE